MVYYDAQKNLITKYVFKYTEFLILKDKLKKKTYNV